MDKEELADDIILPRLMDFGPESWLSAGDVLQVAREQGAGDDVDVSDVQAALRYLESGGEVLYLPAKGYMALRRGEGGP